MKYAFLIPLAAVLFAGGSQAQTQIFRCGSTYTNNAAEAQSKGCKPMEGGNVTVVQGTRVQVPPARVSTAPSGGTAASPVAAASPGAAGPSAQRVDAADQRARDTDARAILEAELTKAETRQAELQKEYNNGEPEKLGPETRNHQKYLDRVAELKAALARNEADIVGIRRELSRLSASK